MNINVNKQGYSLHVEVTMSPRQASQQKQRCDLSTVLNWVFELKQPPVPVVPVVAIVEEVAAPVVAVKKKTTRSRKPRNQTKTTILDEE